MKKYLSILLFLSSIAVYSNTPSLNQLQLSRTVVNTPYGAIIFPRDHETRYRGQEYELFPLESALKAFFGDKNAIVKSLELSVVSLMLQKKWWITDSSGDSKIARMRTFFCRNWEIPPAEQQFKTIESNYCHQFEKISFNGSTMLKDKVNSYLTKKSQYTKEEADKIAKDIIEKKFQYESNLSLRGRIVDYNSFNYQDFPSDSLFSTVFQQNALIYGDTILVLKANDNRSIDLSYFNGQSYGRWGKGSDAGEYLTPAYIKPKEIEGYFLRRRLEYPDKLRNRVRIRTYRVQRDTPIEYAFFKTVHNQKTYVLVFDGKSGSDNSYCMKQVGNIIKTCNWATPMFETISGKKLIGNQPLGTVNDFVPNLIAVLSLDEEGKESLRPDEVINQYRYYSSKSLDQSLKNSDGVGAGPPLQVINNFKMLKQGKKYIINVHYANK